MKVLFDHQTFELQTFGGISRYFVELLQNGVGIEVELALKRSSNRYLDPNDPWCRAIEPGEDFFERVLAGFDFRGKGRIHGALRRLGVVVDPGRVNRTNTLMKIDRGGFDLFHPTYYDPYFLESIGNRPFVVTVFDMIHEIYPEDFFAGDQTSVHKKLLCERANRIVAISNTTKADLIRFFGIAESKIDVIHLASSIGPGNSHPDRPIRTPGKYILFTGNRLFYKNFIFFLRATADLLRRDRGLFVVCTGPPFTSDELDSFEALGVRDQVTHFSVDDEQLAELYRKAEVFVFPSLYEGFGMPLLEAFSCRCPVVASDTAVFREIGGDAVTFFQPKDPGSIGDAIRSTLENRTLRDEMVERGHKRSRRFSWQQTTDQTLCTYERAFNRTG